MTSFDTLIGHWSTESTHPKLDAAVTGHTTFEWLPGDRYLIQRAHNDHESFPDSISVIGPRESGDSLLMEYFDSRGVRRTYDISCDAGTLHIWRDAPGFDQRYTAALDDESFTGLWQLAESPGAWHDDVAVSYHRILETPS
ncbi:MAG TPA: hypothetical protein VFG42_02435 [Baekduia sp.]|uniref:hypothetical protein n=1 Tax=Baekduia sp. TaxID=2600305 RepID=UPI002D770EDF|nr:hypothetical protein [Baekduia sp.]HET6505624.1 hypothetical protein [Baekduia sp.]